MTKDEALKLAREAEFDSHGHIIANQLAHLERFAALVAAAENEANAKVCDEWYEKRGLYGVDVLARVIRARGQA